MPASTPRPRRPATGAADKTELVIITGVSGSGKGTVLKALEDLGYYSVDNLPIELIPKFAELVKSAPNIRRAALVVDIREGTALEKFPGVVQAHPPPGAHQAAVPGSRRCRPDPPFQRNPPSPPAGDRAKRGRQHPPRAGASEAHSRAGRAHHQHQQVQRARAARDHSLHLWRPAAGPVRHPGADHQFRVSPRSSGR